MDWLDVAVVFCRAAWSEGEAESGRDTISLCGNTTVVWKRQKTSWWECTCQISDPHVRPPNNQCGALQLAARYGDGRNTVPIVDDGDICCPARWQVKVVHGGCDTLSSVLWVHLVCLLAGSSHHHHGSLVNVVIYRNIIAIWGIFTLKDAFCETGHLTSELISNGRVTRGTYSLVQGMAEPRLADSPHRVKISAHDCVPWYA